MSFPGNGASIGRHVCRRTFIETYSQYTLDEICAYSHNYTFDLMCCVCYSSTAGECSTHWTHRGGQYRGCLAASYGLGGGRYGLQTEAQPLQVDHNTLSLSKGLTYASPINGNLNINKVNFNF